MWTTLDSSDDYRKQRARNFIPPSDDTITDLSHIDFAQGEKIELIGYIDTKRYSNFQYFSTRAEFENRLSALMGWARKANPRTIYGIVTINKNVVAGENLSTDSIEDAIAGFEDIFIRSIRVPRKYIPPVGSEGEKRKSDNPDYKNIRGNFDLAYRTPGRARNPHMLEFVLYDCGYKNLLKKIKTFEEFAEGLGLRIKVEFSRCTGQKLNK